MPSKDAFQRLIDGLQTLVREHMALARVELKEDLRGMGRDVLAGAAGVPALAAGYLLLMIALGYLLAVWLPSWAAFGIVALANLGIGGLLSAGGVRKVRSRRVDLQRSAEELQQDRRWIATLGDGPRADTEGQLPARPMEGARQPPQPASH
ncbi:MAG TPA: phage holin family protein [Myxococcales bacterium]|nr:phage holin family protein [Myxococcales bacterium]